MFGTIRIVIGIILFIVLVMIGKKTNFFTTKKLYITSSIIAIVFTILMNFIPFENAFVNFKSPQRAYEYYIGERYNIELVVNGEESDLLIGEQNNTLNYLIIPKSNNGWKVGIGTDTKMIKQKIVDDIVIYVYQYKDTSDYYITVMSARGGALTITDVNDSQFLSIEQENHLSDEKLITYYAGVSNFDSQYWLDINGKKITVLG